MPWRADCQIPRDGISTSGDAVGLGDPEMLCAEPIEMLPPSGLVQTLPPSRMQMLGRRAEGTGDLRDVTTRRPNRTTAPVRQQAFL